MSCPQRVLWLVLVVWLAADAAPQSMTIRSFFDRYCVQCHGEEVQKADRRLDNLKPDFKDDEVLAVWQDVLDQLQLGDMPPSKAKQPSDAQKQSVIHQIETFIHRAQATQTNAIAKPLLRRLNRREYRNTVAELLGIEVDLVDPTSAFPQDGQYEGFDNIGQRLVTSKHLLQQYLEAAEIAVEKALPDTGWTPLRPKQWNMKPPFDRTTRMHALWVQDEAKHQPGYQSIMQGTKDRFGYRPLDDMQEGVPHDGIYQVRVRAAAVDRDHPFPDELIGTDRHEPARLALVSGTSERGPLHLRQFGEQTLAVFEMPDDEPQWVEAEIWLDKGFMPRLTYQNGMYFWKHIPHTIHARYPEILPLKLNYRNYFKIMQLVSTPAIRVFDVQVKGPLYQEAPRPSVQKLLGADRDNVEWERSLRGFVSKAFRRPVSDEQSQIYVDFMNQRRENDRESSFMAFKSAIKAVLCSSEFLYLAEPEESRDAEYVLANRLSYFLWSSLPDNALMEAAASKSLSDPVVLRQQVARMLADPKAQAFVEGFVDRWLGLNRLGEMPPDSKKFKNYYVHELQEQMRTETHLFFRHVLEENLPLKTFIDSDFTFVNRPLARLYGIEDSEIPTAFTKDRVGLVEDRGFVKIKLKDKRRGGLLGQASVLTVTANGVDTSPVVRGVWVLENLLGTPPNPPPPGIEPLEPDIRGAKTVRDQLVKHREQPSCNACHQKIDPPGFALENFDAIGAWRTHYDEKKALQVDASARLSNGKSFDDITDFKKYLLTRQRQFTHCLTHKLMIYALGRPLGIRDRPTIDAITHELHRKRGGLQDLVMAVVLSKEFSGSVENTGESKPEVASQGGVHSGL